MGINTKRFWQEREQSRVALDAKRASPSEKKRIRAQVRDDIRFLRTGKIING